MFPANYVELIEDSSEVSQQPETPAAEVQVLLACFTCTSFLFFLVARVRYQQLDRYSDYFKAVDTELHRDHIISLTIFSPFQPNIGMHILHTSLNILVLTWRICQTIKSYLTSQSFPSFLQLYIVYLEVIL